ncbi:MAG: phosphopantetheine-binding protein [Coraliomargarita sp.]
MSLETFIGHLEEAVEDIETGALEAGTCYRDLEAWDSLAVLTVIAMVDLEYGVRLKAAILKECATVQELYERVQAQAGS